MLSPDVGISSHRIHSWLRGLQEIRTYFLTQSPSYKLLQQRI